MAVSNLVEEAKNPLANVSCASISLLPFEMRCNMSVMVPSCIYMNSLFKYLEIFNCYGDGSVKDTILIVIFMIAVGLNMLMSGAITKIYLQPMMTLISVKLSMNEYLAGITLIAFVNSFPEFVANCLSIRSNSALFSNAVSNCLVDVLLCGGVVCFLKPFKMDGYSVVRDMLFLVLAVELNSTIIVHQRSVSSLECAILLLLYSIYIFIQITDLIMMRSWIRNLQKEVDLLMLTPSSALRDEMLAEKIRLLIYLETHDNLHLKKKSNLLGSVNMTNILDQDNRTRAKRPGEIDEYMTRYCLHNKNNSKNVYLISDFFHGINPIDAMDWRLGGWLERSIIILQMPLFLTIKIMIPNIDREINKHGWFKLLNCIQIVICPFFIVTSLHSLLAKNYTGFIIDLNLSLSKWTFVLTVPLALFVFCTTRTDMPPKYHIMFLFLSLPSSFAIIFICTSEVESLCEVLAIAFQMRSEYMNVSVFAVLNSLMNLVVIVGMTMSGYEKMAFAAVLAGPFFSLVVNMAVPMYLNKLTREVGADKWLFGQHGETCYLFFMMTAVTTLLWTSTFNFASRRSGGIFSWLLLFLFFLFSFLIEFNFVHSFSADPVFPMP